MNTDIHSKSSMNQLPESVREIAQRATVAAKDVTGAIEDIAKETSRTLSSKVEEGVERTKECAQHAVDATRYTLETSKEFVRRNPVPVVLGAVAFGVAIGYMLVMARRKPAFGERYVDEPLLAVREAILGALAPVTDRVHKGYDSARDGAEKVMDRVHNFVPGCNGGSFSDHLGRIGNNLKFW
jgi:ElaB/YqjD/DUF883 family membrane-anchored ribosome-binding protein